MRTDTPAFAARNNAFQKSPRFVVRIAYDVDSLALTSHAGIADIPAGTLLEGVLSEPTVTSQRLKPDDAIAEIGSASFALVDIGSGFTSEVRERLLDGAGLRGKRVQFYVGYEDLSFNDFMLIATQVVSSVTFANGIYQINCLDIQRSLRTEVFDPVSTTLGAAVAIGDTTITLTNSAGFQVVPHGGSFSDAPNQLAGYVKIKTEIIRYTGITGNQLTGCTRGVLGTVAAAYPVDLALAAERREKVTEYIYLELPVGKLALSVLTGGIRGNMFGTHGGFETDSNADGLSDNWQNYTNTNTYTRPAGFIGSASQRLQANGGASPRLITQFGVFVPAGTKFTVSAHMLAAVGQTLLLGAKGYNAILGAETASYTNATFAATGAWQRVSTTAVSSALGQWIRPTPGLGGSPPNGTALQIDGVQVEIGDTMTPYVTDIGGPLPVHWHLGIAPELVRTADFTGIGLDLWDPVDDSKGLTLRFEGLTRTDGKRFLEKEVYLCAGLFSPVYSDGTLGLRRMAKVRADAATRITLDDRNSTQVAELTHDMRALHNVFSVNWSWNGTEFRRTSSYVDAASAAKHGEAENVTLSFKGLHGSRHTDGVVFGLLSMLRDRYAGPPLRLSVNLRHHRNGIEVGDIVRVRYQHVRDFTAAAGQPLSIDRAFEVQNVSVDHRSGDVSVELFGSTADPIITAPTQQLGPVASLPDAHYNSQGTQLSTVPGVTIVGNVLTVAPATPIAGNASLTAAGAVFYHLGDLTIAAGVDLKISGNWQLRVRGFLQVNGSINGVGGGNPGVADASQVLFALVPTGIAFFSAFYETIPGNPGYVGSTRGFDGVIGMRLTTITPTQWYDTRPAAAANSLHAVSPRLLLSVSGNALNGLPADIRGSGGPPGGRAQYYGETGGLVAGFIPGGTGGAGGAGLAITCRGMAFGANGYIDLSGADTTGPVTGLTDAGFTIRPGVGGPGGPGTLLVLLDGSGLSVPDFGANKFRGKVGTATLAATPLPQREYNLWNHSSGGTTDGMANPATGFREPEFTTINGADLSGAALTVQHIPGSEVVTPDQAVTVPPLTSLSTESAEQAINVTVGLPLNVEAVEIFMAVTNDRSNATKVFEGLATVIPVRVPDGVTRHFWGRTRVGSLRSDWFPISATAGIVGTSVGGLICRGNCEAFGTGVRKNGGANAWDSDAYSPESYADGVFVTFQASQTNLAFMVGLNSDPDTDSSFSSLDYAWYCRSDATLQFYENGSAQSTGGSYTTSTTLSVKYDGQYVVYMKDGAALRSVYAPGLTLFVDSSFNAAGAACKNLKYGALTASPRSGWIPRGFIAANGTSFLKFAGNNSAFDSDVCSERMLPEGCSLTFTVAQMNKNLLVGLNADVSAIADLSTIDYGWSITSSATCGPVESGVTPLAFTGYTLSTVFQIKYDGQQVIYLKDGVVVRTVQLRGASFYGQAAFQTTSGRVLNLQFEPLTTSPTIPWIIRGGMVATATTAKKLSGTAGTWDADIYSAAAYRGGCAIAGVCDSIGAGMALGLDDSPVAGTDRATLEFCWFPRQTSQGLEIWESNALVLNLGSSQYDTTTHLAIVYDGQVVRYLRNGVIMREKYAPDLTLYGRVAFRDVGGAFRALEFTPQTAATPVPFITRSSQVLIGPTTARKSSAGTNAWDADFFSVQGHTSCHLQFKASQVNGALVVGLNSDPYTDSSYTSIDAGWHVKADGTLGIYESNVAVSGFGSYTTKTQLGITYDGANVRYYKDGVLQRTTAMAALTMFVDASLFTAGAGVNGMQFGVGAVLPLIDTADLSPFSVTEVLGVTFLPPITIGGQHLVLGDTLTYVGLSSINYSSATAIDIESQCSFRILVRNLAGGAVTATFAVKVWIQEAINGAPFTPVIPQFEKATTAVENAAIISRFTYAGHPTDLRILRVMMELSSDGTQQLRVDITNFHLRHTLVKR